jgi:Fe-Mn family superoxide dismutase
VFGIGARRQVTAQSHSDRAGRDFGEAGSDDDPARGHCAGEPGRQRKGNGETVGHPDDDIADGGAGGEVGFLVTVMIVVIIVVMIGGGHFIPLERGPENQTRFLSGGSASIIMGQDLGKEKIIMTTPTAGAAPQGTFTVPALPYSFDALEPYIDAKTMEIHHDKHHGAYVTNLNKALDGQADLQKLSIEELVAHLDRVPENIRTAVRNNGGGHLNHSMFWKIMKKGGGGEPTGAVADAIKAAFGNFADFKIKVNQAAATRFGSGWAWVLFRNGKLAIESTANQDNPISDGGKAFMGVDVWEHAYYLKYQNRRPDYLEAWWNVVNWDQITENFHHAQK